MYLETDRLIVRNFDSGDLDDLYEIFSDSEVMFNIESPFDRVKTKNFLDTFCIQRKCAYATVLKDSGKVIGYILLKSVDEAEIFEIGWIFNKLYWQKGYAFEACNRVLNHAFIDMNAHKICAKAVDDIKSVSLMKKLGPVLEGIQRKHTKSNIGVWSDLHLYAVLKDDYFSTK